MNGNRHGTGYGSNDLGSGVRNMVVDVVIMLLLRIINLRTQWRLGRCSKECGGG